MGDQVKNAIIGLFVLSAVALIAFILIFLHPSSGNQGKVLRARFANIDKVSLGTRVSYAGRPVGEVIEIREIDNTTDKRIPHHGFVYSYELTMAIDSHLQIYTTDQISLRTSGLLGEKSVAITPKPVRKGGALVPAEGHILYANEIGSMEEAFGEFKELADKFEDALDIAHASLLQLNNSNLWNKIASAAESFHNLTAAYNNPMIVESLSGSLFMLHRALAHIEEHGGWEQFSRFLAHAEQIARAIDQPGSLKNTVENLSQFSDGLAASSGSIKEALVAFQAAATSVNEVTSQVAKGHGTVGRLFRDDDLYLKVAATLGKAETTMDDINHYGLLFNLDKNWQRLRARRANLLQRLSTPSEFSNYFNDEVNAVSTSLSRLDQLLQRTEALGAGSPALREPQFRRVFAELLRRVDGLQENLTLYNEQLVDPANDLLMPR